ncbi:RHS repeat domain-containing protein [Flavobacterium sp. B183]|uniref:RHS repeat domain-containing protein n=1 Tax=Flavobacterium sp. B183 TaxID=907046 RepID=UPI003531CE3D
MRSQAVPSRPTLQFFPTAEGYYDDIYKKYVYQYKDHLGNVRVSYAKNPVTQVLEIIEENNYYPFGLKHAGYNDYVATNNKYKYNGKELQDELGLGVYDYGFRNFDPALGRWMNIDPLAELYVGITPYSYTFNNPVRFIDPDGRYVDDSYIYQKYTSGKNKGEYKNPNLVKAWEVFANSKTGIAFLSNFARENQVIAGHEYKESGKYDKNNTDLNFGSMDPGETASGQTSHKKDGNHLQLTILLDEKSSNKTNFEAIGYEIDNIAHEAFIHVESYADDFLDGKLDLSNIRPEYITSINQQIKKDPAKRRANTTSVLQHWMGQDKKTLEKNTFPILKQFYENAGIKKSDKDINKIINTYRD